MAPNLRNADIFTDGPTQRIQADPVMDNFDSLWAARDALAAQTALIDRAVVTSLPGGPVDGQECFYRADATTGVIWHLKYRSASASASAYKWEFVGGASSSRREPPPATSSPPTA